MGKLRKKPAWEPPPLDPRKFDDPYRKKKKKRTIPGQTASVPSG